MTNCSNCGAPVDLEEKRCPYCETPYTRQAAAISEAYMININCATLAAAMKKSTITSNEARRRLGFSEI